MRFVTGPTVHAHLVSVLSAVGSARGRGLALPPVWCFVGVRAAVFVVCLRVDVIDCIMLTQGCAWTAALLRYWPHRGSCVDL